MRPSEQALAKLNSGKEQERQGIAHHHTAEPRLARHDQLKAAFLHGIKGQLHGDAQLDVLFSLFVHHGAVHGAADSRKRVFRQPAKVPLEAAR